MWCPSSPAQLPADARPRAWPRKSSSGRATPLKMRDLAETFPLTSMRRQATHLNRKRARACNSHWAFAINTCGRVTLCPAGADQALYPTERTPSSPLRVPKMPIMARVASVLRQPILLKNPFDKVRTCHWKEVPLQIGLDHRFPDGLGVHLGDGFLIQDSFQTGRLLQ